MRRHEIVRREGMRAFAGIAVSFGVERFKLGYAQLFAFLLPVPDAHHRREFSHPKTAEFVALAAEFNGSKGEKLVPVY